MYCYNTSTTSTASFYVFFLPISIVTSYCDKDMAKRSFTSELSFLYAINATPFCRPSCNDRTLAKKNYRCPSFLRRFQKSIPKRADDPKGTYGGRKVKLHTSKIFLNNFFHHNHNTSSLPKASDKNPFPPRRPRKFASLHHVHSNLDSMSPILINASLFRRIQVTNLFRV